MPARIFGEIALVQDIPRTATVRAAIKSEVIKLNGDAFRKLLADLPGLRDAVLTGMARRLHELDARA